MEGNSSFQLWACGKSVKNANSLAKCFFFQPHSHFSSSMLRDSLVNQQWKCLSVGLLISMFSWRFNDRYLVQRTCHCIHILWYENIMSKIISVFLEGLRYDNLLGTNLNMFVSSEENGYFVRYSRNHMFCACP